MDLMDVIREKSSQVEPLLKHYSKTGDERIQEMIFHPIDAGGKRIRPVLTLLACEAVAGEPRKALAAAASVELLHTFTLVHDDIMDCDCERRGKPTVHNLWGNGMGIMVGDALYSSAFKALLDSKKQTAADDVLKAVEVLVNANTELQEGQMMDMLFEGKDNITQEEYMSMIRKKTGALIEASALLGGIMGGADSQQMESLRVYGNNTGIAFQIKDDILDLKASQEKLGKPVGSDIRSGKKTLIIVHALAHARQETKKKILAVLGDTTASKEDVDETIRLLEETGSIRYAQEMVEKLNGEGKKALLNLPENDARGTLEELADYLIMRST
jgi:geranylgeranyl diphosphate synthase, type I